MQIFSTLINPDGRPLALTIGNFDGVHIGHQKILKTVVETAKQYSITPAVMTFSPHAKVFFGRAENFLIYSDSEKARFIKNCGVKRLYQIPFERAFSEIEPEQFVKRLIEDLQVKHLLIGDDFRFGYRGRGNFQLLCELCSDYGVSVANTPTITYKDTRVSSSRVRRAIEAADFAKVGHLLGRDLSYRGEVIAGNQLGRTIGFATANIQLPRARLLPDGVFVVKVNIEGDEKSYYGMSNIGTKPTVDNSDRRQIETHIFDFCENLYEKTIVVTPLVKLRDEQKFSGVEALVAQLQRDKQQALKLLS